ncbi:alpha-amylase family glycosyl hydrolase [Lederbergia lenta]|uniref:LPXTG-motif cell wall anchor domain-containing protein n=1 Tax=Lederbergia lenta TaxID=1467 RepID=A0A2X4ZBQ3_LEDLE|nr:alpha-amylase family glycosyl hydrolase [Lederbergia lenta]MEC2322846.1 alpha-amylase family glycosyl hydrolase [Lederbergia lenta]SQI61915.1 LPXTG-motif cell wall anchor domain-containing protein [Lederbergia lenta]
MTKKVQQKKMSVFAILLMIFSLFSGYLPQISAESNSTLGSPVLNEDRTVTFNYEDASAGSVRVAGSFTNWDEHPLVMVNDEGLWTTTTDELTPDVYEYKFILGDDEWIKDPLNIEEEGGNSKLVVPGINLIPIASLQEINSTTKLKANIIEGNGIIQEESSEITWSLESAPPGVEINGATLTITENAPVGTIFIIKATKGNDTATKEIEISAQMNQFTINYHRIDNNLEDWNVHIYEGGYEARNYNFESEYAVQMGDGKEFKFSKGTYSFPNNSFKIIPRKANWESQDLEQYVLMPEGKKETEIWIIQGYPEVYMSESAAIAALTDSVSPHIQFVYERSDANYDDWDVWVWGTEAQNDNINFTNFKDGKAIADIGVGPLADRVGFKVRKGNWEQEEPGGDRYIDVNRMDPITKVYVKSGETEFFTVPSMEAPEVNNGNATFYYRDKNLYVSDQMSKIEKVELSILGERHEMTREKNSERFVFTYNDLPYGDHEYTFFVTIEGETTEVADPYFAVDGKSIISFFKPEMEIKGTVSPAAIDYSQNAVLTLDLLNETEAELRGIYVDLTEVGGESNVTIDPDLDRVTIAVHESITAGVKTLPLKVVDVYGNEHTGEAKVTVKARNFVGEADFDWDEARIYFLLTDRFFNGDTTNDDPYRVGYDKNEAGAYQGGDFKGITEKLDYLHDLGINTIWINPIVENIAYDVRYNDEPHLTPYYAYHGYWASNFNELNPHFGTMDDFHELIDEAHARGMKLMVDVVVNHAGYGLKESDEALDGTIPQFPTNQDRERFAGMLRDGGSGDIKGELAGLPDFMTEEPDVRQQLIDWQTQWIEKSRTPNGNTIDYFRLDTVKHVENTTWRALKNALTNEMPEFKMIGEAWGASQHNDYGYLNSGMMDSLLDFDFKYQARDFVNGKIDSVENDLNKRNDLINNTATLGQFLSSHDEDGFLQQFKGEEGKWGKLMVAASVQITAKGQPVIYYGEELGISGENNYPYLENRQNLPWDKVDGNEILEHYTKVLNARKDHSAIFSKGTRQTLAGSDELGYSVFERAYAGESAIVGLNTGIEATEITFSVPFSVGQVVTDVYSGKNIVVGNDQKVTVQLPGMQDGGTFILVVENENEQPVEEDVPVKNETPKVNEKQVESGKTSDDETAGLNELSTSQAEKKLPNTSTALYNWLMLGVLLFIIGSAILLAQRKRKANKIDF